VPFLPRNFKLKDGGIWYEYPPDDEGRSKAPVWCCVELEIVAETRAGDGKNWGKLLRWKDRDGRQHEWAMPSTMLAGDGTEYRKELLYGGLAIADTKAGKEKLNLLLLSARLKERATAVARVGWHDAGFVLPDETIGAANGERLLLQTENPLVDGLEVRGDVEQWRAAVGKYLPGNSG
jgi:putative DNA primase/helicase